MIRALIVDDEAPARQRFIRLLSKFSDIEIVGEATNGLQALEKNETLKPDVIFLDIEMPELDGLGVAEALPIPGPRIIFVTAFNEHALKAFELNAMDYLVKPVAEERLENCILKIRSSLKMSRLSNSTVADVRNQLAEENSSFGRRFAVRTGNRYIICDPEQVSAVISRDHYSGIIFEGRELLADDSLEQMEQRLSPAQFMRVHRSALINVDFLCELEREGDRKYIAVLNDKVKTRVPVSRERLGDLKARLGIS